METLEVVRVRIKEGRETDMLAARPAMIEAGRSRFPGLIDATLARLPDGLWLDVVRWQSQDQAHAAAEAFPTIPECVRMNDVIEEIVAFEHGVDREPGAG